MRAGMRAALMVGMSNPVNALLPFKLGSVYYARGRDVALANRAFRLSLHIVPKPFPALPKAWADGYAQDILSLNWAGAATGWDGFGFR